jgi:hypothetical protein
MFTFGIVGPLTVVNPTLSPEQIAWSDQVKTDAQLALLEMGIDLPFSRWRNACEYIAVERQRALYELKCDVLELLFYAKSMNLAKKRREGVVNGVSPVRAFDDLPTRNELVEATLWFEYTFGRGGTK